MRRVSAKYLLAQWGILKEICRMTCHGRDMNAALCLGERPAPHRQCCIRRYGETSSSKQCLGCAKIANTCSRVNDETSAEDFNFTTSGSDVH